MPLTPRRILKGIEAGGEGGAELKKGEEGLLFPFELRGERYLAKQWRGHDFRKDQASVIFEDESARTPVSPFWHKLKHYERDLIYEAFPEHTLASHGGFDPRITQEPGEEPEYDYTGGRPVTVTKEIPEASDARGFRDRLVGGVSKEILDRLERKPGGRLVADPIVAETARFLVSQVQAEMAKRFGYFPPGVIDWNRPKESLLELRDKVAAEAPDSIFVEMLGSGVVSLNPEFDFIPTGESTEKGPQGVFIEVAIASPALLLNRLRDQSKSPESWQRIGKQLDRYLLYRNLDEIYDDIFIFQHLPPKGESLLHDHDATERVVQLLWAARGSIERNQKSAGRHGLVEQDANFLRGIHREIKDAFADISDKQQLLAKLDEIRKKTEDADW